MISENIVEEIRRAVDLREVAAFYGISINRAGFACCPFHNERTASCHVYADHFHCFGCGAGGDAIAFVRKYFDLSFPAAIERINVDFGLDLPIGRPQSARDILQGQRIRREREQRIKAGNEQKRANTKDFTQYYRECRKRINDPAAVDYLSLRGISLKTANAFWIGFDPQADPAESGHRCPRIIVPVSKSHYIARSIDPKTPKRYAKLNNKGVTPDIFNVKVLWNQKDPVFVTEGIFDALAIEEVGCRVVSLNSAVNTSALLAIFERRPPDAPIIICLDADETGQRQSASFSIGLRRLGITHTFADICCGRKDPNEALTADGNAFFDAANVAREEALKI